MDQLNDLALAIGGQFWNIVACLAVILALYLGFRTKFVQFRLFGDALRLVKERITAKEKVDGVSGFQAFCVTLGGCIGTGNVAGVAMAIIVGGPGVVVWMWVIALLGACTSFVENTLAQVYKVKEGGIFRGGPAYYMEKGLGRRWLGILYAFIMIVSLGFALVGLQTNTIVLSIGAAFHLPNFITALVVAGLTALVIFGGVKRIANVAERAVPLMTLAYVLLLAGIIIINIKNVPAGFALIFREAFSARAVTGAAFSTIVFQGIKRGVFSSGAGHGDAPTTGASADVSRPVKQGLFGTLAIYMDTCVVCTATALAIIFAGVYTGTDYVGIELTQFAFTSVLGQWVGYIFSLCIFIFCFTSVMANYYCGETCLSYLTRQKMHGYTVYRVLFVIVIFLGGIASVDLIWNIADAFLAVMIIVNMVSLLFVGHKVIPVIRDYIRQRKDGKDPVFRARDVGIENADCWN